VVLVPVTAVVSFARTPLDEIAAKVEVIKARGWQEREDGRGDPWVASFVKHFPEGTGDVEAELRDVMGDYWLDADAIRALLASK
jgi:hypothetical protein